MSRLTIAATALLLVLSSGVARGAETPSTESRPARRDAVWTIDGRVGYARAWTTGVSHLGTGEGLSLGRTWPSRIHLEVQAFRFQGQEVTARNETLAYRAEYASTQLQAGLGYEVPFGIVHVRPSIHSGVSFIDGHTAVGTVKDRDEVTRWMVGPSLAVLVHVWRLVAGVDAQAFFVPSDVAAPTLGVYGVLGTTF